jgi:hypothetical protein
MDADRSHIIPFELFVLAVLLYRNSLVRIFNIGINVHYEVLYLRHCYCNKTPQKSNGHIVSLSRPEWHETINGRHNRRPKAAKKEG